MSVLGESATGTIRACVLMPRVSIADRDEAGKRIDARIAMSAVVYRMSPQASADFDA